jgi:uncharacterized protein
MTSPTFQNILDLARLPYFSVRGGRLVLADPALGPAIDVHTHLALSYGPVDLVDLERPSYRTEHYLPAECPIDFEVYQNKNFTPEDMTRMKLDLSIMSFTGSGMRRTHTAPNLTREMDELGIARSVLLPIDFPFWSRNSPTWLKIAAREHKLIGFGSVHPYQRNMEQHLDAQVALGARGIKVHPAVQMVPPEDKRAMRLYQLCGERNLPVLFHCGPVDIETAAGRKMSQVYRYEKALAENPKTTFVLGHSGALQMRDGLALSHRYANTYLEISSQSLPGVQALCAEAPPGRLLFGTDWPFYHQAIGLAKVFLATEGNDKLRRDVLHDNAAKLFGIS